MTPFPGIFPVAGCFGGAFFFCRYKGVQCARFICKLRGSAAWPGFYVLTFEQEGETIQSLMTFTVACPAVTLHTFDAALWPLLSRRCQSDRSLVRGEYKRDACICMRTFS